MVYNSTLLLCQSGKFFNLQYESQIRSSYILPLRTDVIEAPVETSTGHTFKEFALQTFKGKCHWAMHCIITKFSDGQRKEANLELLCLRSIHKTKTLTKWININPFWLGTTMRSLGNKVLTSWMSLLRELRASCHLSDAYLELVNILTRDGTM